MAGTRWILGRAAIAVAAAASLTGAARPDGGLWLEEAFDLETYGAFGDREAVDLALARRTLGAGFPFVASPRFERFPRFAAPRLAREWARSGRWSLRFRLRGEPMRAVSDPRLPRAAEPGGAFVLEAWAAARDAEGASVRLGIEWVGAGSAVIGESRSPGLLLRGTAAWTPLRCEGRAPARATHLRYLIEVIPSSPGPGTGRVYVDDIAFRWIPTLRIETKPAARLLAPGERLAWRITSRPIAGKVLRAPARRPRGRDAPDAVPASLRRLWREEGGAREANRRHIVLRLLDADGRERARRTARAGGVPEEVLEWRGAFPEGAVAPGPYTVAVELWTARRGASAMEARVPIRIGFLPPDGGPPAAGGLVLAAGWPAGTAPPRSWLGALPGPLLVDARGEAPPAWAQDAAGRLALWAPEGALRTEEVASLAARAEVAVVRGPGSSGDVPAALARVPMILAQDASGGIEPVRGARGAQVLERPADGGRGARDLARAIAECAARGIDAVLLPDPDALVEEAAGGVGPRAAFFAWATIGGALAGGVKGAWAWDPRGTFLRAAGLEGERAVAWAHDAPFVLSYPSRRPLRVTDPFGRTKMLAPRAGIVEIPIERTPVVIDGVDAGRDAIAASVRVPETLGRHARWQPFSLEIANPGPRTAVLRVEACCDAADVRLEERTLALGPGERGRVRGRIRLRPTAEDPVRLEVVLETDGGRAVPGARAVAPASLGPPPFAIEGLEGPGGGAGPSARLRVRNLAARAVRAHIHVAVDGRQVARWAGRPMGPGEVCALPFRLPASAGGARVVRVGIVREGDGAFAGRTIRVSDAGRQGAPAPAPAGGTDPKHRAPTEHFRS